MAFWKKNKGKTKTPRKKQKEEKIRVSVNSDNLVIDILDPYMAKSFPWGDYTTNFKLVNAALKKRFKKLLSTTEATFYAVEQLLKSPSEKSEAALKEYNSKHGNFATLKKRETEATSKPRAFKIYPYLCIWPSNCEYLDKYVHDTLKTFRPKPPIKNKKVLARAYQEFTKPFLIKVFDSKKSGKIYISSNLIEDYLRFGSEKELKDIQTELEIDILVKLLLAINKETGHETAIVLFATSESLPAKHSREQLDEDHVIYPYASTWNGSWWDYLYRKKRIIMSDWKSDTKIESKHFKFNVYNVCK